tara:strand:- start:59 stop:490 length:432 start_codon:yes stop_codon:yes gene_type:complete
MNRREESIESEPGASLYKGSAEKPAQKVTSEPADPSAEPTRTGFSFSRNLGGRSFTWIAGEDSDLGAKVAALPPHKQKYVVGHLEEALADKTKKFGLNDSRTQEWKEYLAIARKSSKRTSKKKKHNKNKGMRKKRSRDDAPRA